MRTVPCATGLALLFAAAAARADGPNEPTPQVQAAAAEYDAGRRAYMAGSYAEAAAHFENAWHDAPRPEALRNAIRSRARAGQASRAATLALVAARRYPNDEETTTLVKETLAESAPRLGKVIIRCTPACAATLDERAVSDGESEEVAFYADPGDHQVVVVWSGGRRTVAPVRAGAGETQKLALEAPPFPPSPVTKAVPPPKPLPPIVFIAGVGLTLVAGVATTASYVSAKNDPGEDAVRRDCVGLGESCPTYQRGLDGQLRTNILLGSTAVLGVATAIVGVFFTRWTGPKSPALRAFVGAESGAGFAGVSGQM